MKTKRAKTITSVFFPVGEPFEAVVREWVEELRRSALRAGRSAASRRHGSGGRSGLFGLQGLDRRPVVHGGPIREIFRRACAAVGSPTTTTRTASGGRSCGLAYDLDLARDSSRPGARTLDTSRCLTSLGSYGALSSHEQADVMGTISQRDNPAQDVEAALATIQEAIARSRAAPEPASREP